MADDLEARLQSHAQAFKGLLSLIPAKYYYEQDHTDDWQKKKQTPEERKLAKKAKLRPDAQKSAKDVMEENERKRRREDGEGEEVSDLDVSDKERPLQGLKTPKKKAQKQKAEQDVHSKNSEQKASQLQPPKKTKEQKTKEKELKRKAKAVRKTEKKELRKAKKQAAAGPETASAQPVKEASTKKIQNGTSNGTLDTDEGTQIEGDTQEGEAIVLGNDMEVVDVTGLVPDIQADAQSSASVSPAPGSTFSHTSPQPTSSNSSVVPLPAEDEPTKPANDLFSTAALAQKSARPTTDVSIPKKLRHLSPAEKEANKLKLAARIEEMRKARNADGLNGKPAKNRAELIEARRLKQEKRKQHKKELRAEQKEAEKNQDVEAELAKLRGSPSVGSDLFSGGNSPPNNFAFGRVAFNDGQRVNSSLSGLVDIKKKGTTDTRAALLAAEKKRARLLSYDDEKRADIEQKDVWLNASKKVHGERVRDDTNLLKKTLKRKDKMKLKSEKEWNERIEGVKKGQAFQQKKREENLAKRKEEKGSKGKGAKKGGAKKKKSRPGFEGSFRGRA